MAPVVEFLTMRLKPGQNAISDPNTHEGKSIAASTKYVKDFKGVQFLKSGTRIEDPDVFQEFVVWESREAHEAFLAHDGFNDFAQGVWALGAEPNHGDFSLSFFDISPLPNEALSAPVTEVLSAYFPAEATETTLSEFQSNATKFLKGIEPACEGRMIANAGGWSIDDISTDKVEGGKAKVYVHFIGWTSVAAHHEARDSKEFADNAYLLAGANLDMWHVGQN